MPRSTLDTASCRDDGADGRRVQAARAARLNSLVVAASTVSNCSSDAPAAASARRAWWSARSRRVRAIGAPGGVGASPSVGLPASRAPSSSASAAKAPWAAATVSTAAARCLSDSWARHAAAQATLQSSARPRVFGLSSALACAEIFVNLHGDASMDTGARPPDGARPAERRDGVGGRRPIQPRAGPEHVGDVPQRPAVAAPRGRGRRAVEDFRRVDGGARDGRGRLRGVARRPRALDAVRVGAQRGDGL